MDLPIQLTGEGRYYARFYAGAGYGTDPYTLSTDFLPVDDSYEPNDSEDTAAAISIGEEIEAWQWNSVGQSTTVWGDEDYYSFTTASAGDLTISITGWNSILNWGSDYDTIHLYETTASDTLLLDGAMMGGDYSQTVALPSAGEYILALHAGVAVSTETVLDDSHVHR